MHYFFFTVSIVLHKHGEEKQNKLKSAEIAEILYWFKVII